MESVGTKSSRIGFEAPAPHIVVACPSCKTSFAVETAAVAALETPRFHCSRCDDVFVLKDSASDTRPGPLQVQSLTRNNASSFSRTAPVTNRAVNQESLIKPSDFSISAPSYSQPSYSQPSYSQPSHSQPSHSQPSHSQPSHSQPSHSQPSHSQPSHSQPSTYSAPSALGVAAPKAASPNNAQSVSQIRPTTEETSNGQQSTTKSSPTPRSELSLLSQGFLDAEDSSESETIPAQSSTPIEATIAPVLAPVTINHTEEPSPRKFVLSDPTPQPSKPVQAKIESPTTEAYRPTPPRRPETVQTDLASVAAQGRRFSPRTQGLISMSLPILGVMVALLGLSYTARISPQSIDALANAALPSFAKESVFHLPPSKLSVRNISFKFKKTRSKETIGVVTGSITNETGKSIVGVEVEALGFNDRGEIVLSSRAPLRSALGNEKITDLSLETVRRFQSSLNAREASIAPKETIPFTVALVDNRGETGDETEDDSLDLSKVKYFSARIFSVR